MGSGTPLVFSDVEVPEELLDIRLEHSGLLQHFARRFEHLRRCGAGLRCRLIDATDVVRYLLGAGRGLLNVARDLLSRGLLFFTAPATAVDDSDIDSII